ncbi:hypothetical protein EX30DRAFT_339299 [Ascodesmis nigricans]|uniref:C3H1-type domain-containing protein n=1 Tax=Ascodesmis nigricans TaxID=341454 RepID=A0A4S2N247_9PEZI|nr:hypothetical protein EX30DRAFT_339299 [Ascodesmis nigricans]
MSEDNDALLARISSLAGQINRHKNQQDSAPRASASSQVHRGASFYRARGRGHPYWHQTRPPRGRGHTHPTAHRHKTLILNKPSSSSTGTDPSAPFSGDSIQGSAGSGATSTTTTGDGWVARRDRHMQLINSSVYDKEMENRSKAIAKTLEEKLKRREAKEQLKMTRYLQSSGHQSNHEVVIAGISYKVVASGSKLVRQSGTSLDQTPKKATVAGVQFTRSKNGNLIRTGFVRATRLQHKPINEPCKFFSTTGKCKNGKSCRYIHDPDKVAICPLYLSTGMCPDGDSCDLSHDATPHRVPACHHFLRGNCSHDDCRYAHVRVNPAAPICRAFAYYGYCSDGGNCSKRHVHECPEFDEKGDCTDPKCKLQHVERAGRKRAAAAAAAPPTPEKRRADTSGDGGSSSASDDEEDDITSDVDSEDEFLEHHRGAQEDDATMQLDYIKF